MFVSKKICYSYADVTCSVQTVHLTMHRKYKVGLSHQRCHDFGCVKAKYPFGQGFLTVFFLPWPTSESGETYGPLVRKMHLNA